MRLLKSGLIIPFLLIVCWSCSEDDSKTDLSLTSYELDQIEYLKEIALGFEFGSASEITRKWNGDMNIFVKGTSSSDLSAELSRIKDELNQLITDNFEMNIVSDESMANYIIFFGSANDYAALYPSQATLVSNNWGLFSIFWNGQNYLTNGHMYVDIERANLEEQKHLLREELTQSLGLAKDSPRYDGSIFQEEWTRTNEYAQIDRDIIRLLYHPGVGVGLNSNEVDAVLRTILSQN
ncbi:DUF2927 domain-containing protein [Spongiivirga sp. MCCC 1A20706]|uniref:DUF2927 domain-containing protein n=1 Tax=Spongiivirga sp. MCCC 1A20706 TaxID=3160963 RepID=UPI00397743F5